jgi:hypothetical protein
MIAPTPTTVAGAPIGVSTHSDADMADMRTNTDPVADMGANAHTTDMNPGTDLSGRGGGAYER